MISNFAFGCIAILMLLLQNGASFPVPTLPTQEKPKETGQAYYTVDSACGLQVIVDRDFAVLFPMRNGSPDFAAKDIRMRGRWHFEADPKKIQGGCAHYEIMRPDGQVLR